MLFSKECLLDSIAIVDQQLKSTEQKGHRVFKQSESPLTKSMMDLALSQCN